MAARRATAGIGAWHRHDHWPVANERPLGYNDYLAAPGLTWSLIVAAHFTIFQAILYSFESNHRDEFSAAAFKYI